MRRLLVVIAVFLASVLPVHAGEKPVRIATFEADITPPLGTPLCDGLVTPAKEIVDPLTARGIVILTDDWPIVLCALDWVGIGNGGYDAFRAALAKAAGTTADRVAVHSLHQHDAPGCDFEADAILVPFGLGGKLFDPDFARKAMERTATSLKKGLDKARPITHIGVSKAKVEEVASNRRVMGPDGKVKYVRYSSTKDPKVRAEPEGVIDPYVHVLSFWDNDKALVSITYYATHPQSYYGGGGVSADFPGLARRLRDQDAPNVFHIHFNGAGGNVTAGKYNDGSKANRPVLAQRLAKGMKEGDDSVKKMPLTAKDVEWRIAPVTLPLSKRFNVKDLETRVADEKLKLGDRLQGARILAFARRCDKGAKIELSCLRLGNAYVVHMPGELFIEYQLAAQKMRPESAVMLAAYGDYGMGYIGTAISYTQGGYETGPVSRVSPEVEEVLMTGMQKLLK